LAGDQEKGRMNIDGIVELDTHIQRGFWEASLEHVEPSRTK
jgi:hypothetical protein